MSWIGGVDVFPGIRFIPESPVYKVRPEHVDVVVTLGGRDVPCLMVSQLPLGSSDCFSLPNLVGYMATHIENHSGLSVEKIRFTGKHYFPETSLVRTSDSTFQRSV